MKKLMEQKLAQPEKKSSVNSLKTFLIQTLCSCKRRCKFRRSVRDREIHVLCISRVLAFFCLGWQIPGGGDS